MNLTLLCRFLAWETSSMALFIAFVGYTTNPPSAINGLRLPHLVGLLFGGSGRLTASFVRLR